MPCNSDYLAPTTLEVETQRAAKLLVYLRARLGKKVEPWMEDEADKYYADDKRIWPALCADLSSLTPEQTEEIVYDAHSEMARDLASWWERHQREDAKRTAAEDKERRTRELRAKAEAKLTPEELEALGSK